MKSLQLFYLFSAPIGMASSNADTMPQCLVNDRLICAVYPVLQPGLSIRFNKILLQLIHMLLFTLIICECIFLSKNDIIVNSCHHCLFNINKKYKLILTWNFAY